MRQIDLAGQRFGRWSVVGRAPNTPQGQARWLCRCDCGTMRTLKSILLRRGITGSCGCYKRELVIARSTKHGHAPSSGLSPTYTTWAAMIARCTNPKNSHYHLYGALGVTVCERWSDFRNFLADMGEKPRGLSLDRVDTNGNYETANCRWATPRQQAQNKRTNRLITHNGVTKCLAEWARGLGMHAASLAERLDKGWPIGEALSTPKYGRLTQS